MTVLAEGGWFAQRVVQPGRLPLFVFLCAFIVGFAVIRFSVRMIRAQVRWWPGNVEPGGMHIHHVVFGVVFMLVSAVSLITVNEPSTLAKSVLAGVFGVGAALVLDEFALILHLRDVYWSEEGRTSVDAVFVAVALVGLVLLGFRPIGVLDWSDYRADPTPANAALLGLFVLLELGLALVTLLKGKVWTGLLGLFFLPLLIAGAMRLSRPGAPWARWRYRDKPGRLERAVRRDLRWRGPVITAKIRVQEFVSGAPDRVGGGEDRGDGDPGDREEGGADGGRRGPGGS